MNKSGRRYPADYRERLVELVWGGRTPEELSREFEPSAQSIRNWVAQADVEEGRGADGWTRRERKKLRRLRAENRRLRQEREILKKAAAWFARETVFGVFRFMSAHRAEFRIATMARVLGVSRSGYYAWRRRTPTVRVRKDEALLDEIRQIHRESMELRERGG